MGNIVDISVLICCFNKEPYLDEAVTSILRQTKQPKEIIIVHDECREPVHHAKATTIMLKSNVGVAKARQVAFRFSTGKLVLFLDGDDILSPDYLEKMILKIAEGADVSYPDIYHFGDAGTELVIMPDVTPKLLLDLRKLPIPVTCLMKREVYEELGGFGEFPVMEDFDFWLRAMCDGYTFKKAETLLWYRQQGVKRNAVDPLKKRQIMDEMLDKFIISAKKIKRKR